LAAQIRHGDHDRFGYEVAFLAAHKNALVDEIESTGVPLTCFGAGGSADITWIRRLRRHLVEHRIDVVHVHSPVAAAAARVAVRTIRSRRRPRILTTEHNVWPSHTRLTRWADGLTAAADDAHLAVSAAVRDSLPAWLQSRTEVLPHGVDVEALRAERAHRSSVRDELGVDGAVVVGTVANLRATKGWPDLLRAARAVLDERPEVCFVGVGQGPLEAEIAQLHRELGLGPRFRLMGYRADAARLMAGFDVFCLASHHEGLPVALMEAMALELPIVATDVGGVGELVTDGIHGRLVPPRQPSVLARAIVELVGDSSMREQAARAARASADTLSIERAVRRVEEIYAALARS
jgi:glycosyltransferase involved in cell wall biosynthesis